MKFVHAPDHIIPSVFQEERELDGVVTVPIKRYADMIDDPVVKFHHFGTDFELQVNKGIRNALYSLGEREIAYLSFFDGELKRKTDLIKPVRITTPEYRPVIFEHVKVEMEKYAVKLLTDKHYTFPGTPPYRQVQYRLSEYDSGGKSNLLVFTNWNTGGHASILSAGYAFEVCDNGLILGGEGVSKRLRHTKNINTSIFELLRTMEHGIDIKFDEKIILESINKHLSKRWREKLDGVLKEYNSDRSNTFDYWVQPLTHMMRHMDIPFSTYIAITSILQSSIQVKAQID